jgi:hypothetical protein
MCGLLADFTPYNACTPPMSSNSIERVLVPPDAIEGSIVAPPDVEWPRPRQCPYSWQATACRSNELPVAGMLPGPSCHSHEL